MNQVINIAKKVILEESKELERLADSIDNSFQEAVKILSECNGHIIVTGMGKSGHVGNKIAATFASTGSPSFFVHPAEASHGDLGMVTNRNVVIAISNSGESKELFDMLEYCKRNGIPLIAITAKSESTLASYADIALILPYEKEACILNLAPTTSTTATLALGDALAVALYSVKEFSKIDFGNFHPGGKLGKQLAKAKDVMRPYETIAIVGKDDPIKEAILEITSKSSGFAIVRNNEKEIIGIITDGDLRRHMLEDVINDPVHIIMTEDPKTIEPDELAVDAMHFMNMNKIHYLPVVDDDKLIGFVHIHDLIRLGF